MFDAGLLHTIEVSGYRELDEIFGYIERYGFEGAKLQQFDEDILLRFEECLDKDPDNPASFYLYKYGTLF